LQIVQMWALQAHLERATGAFFDKCHQRCRGGIDLRAAAAESKTIEILIAAREKVVQTKVSLSKAGHNRIRARI